MLGSGTIARSHKVGSLVTICKKDTHVISKTALESPSMNAECVGATSCSILCTERGFQNDGNFRKPPAFKYFFGRRYTIVGWPKTNELGQKLTENIEQVEFKTTAGPSEQMVLQCKKSIETQLKLGKNLFHLRKIQ